jgi:hypothetical protein
VIRRNRAEQAQRLGRDLAVARHVEQPLQPRVRRLERLDYGFRLRVESVRCVHGSQPYDGRNCESMAHNQQRLAAVYLTTEGDITEDLLTVYQTTCVQSEVVAGYRS